MNKETTVIDKNVLCFRCIRVYNISKAPKKRPEKLDIYEPCCPYCSCKLYYS